MLLKKVLGIVGATVLAVSIGFFASGCNDSGNPAKPPSGGGDSTVTPPPGGGGGDSTVTPPPGGGGGDSTVTPPGGGGDSTIAPSGLDGTWVGLEDGMPVTLVINGDLFEYGNELFATKGTFVTIGTDRFI